MYPLVNLDVHKVIIHYVFHETKEYTVAPGEPSIESLTRVYPLHEPRWLTEVILTFARGDPILQAEAYSAYLQYNMVGHANRAYLLAKGLIPQRQLRVEVVLWSTGGKVTLSRAQHIPQGIVLMRDALTNEACLTIEAHLSGKPMPVKTDQARRELANISAQRRHFARAAYAKLLGRLMGVDNHRVGPPPSAVPLRVHAPLSFPSSEEGGPEGTVLTPAEQFILGEGYDFQDSHRRNALCEQSAQRRTQNLQAAREAANQGPLQ